MQHPLFNALTVLLSLGLSTGLYAGCEPGAPCLKYEFPVIQNAIDTFICCSHWIVCPYCLKDPDRQIKKLREAIDNDKPEEINHIIRQRGLSPNQPVHEWQLPIIYAAKSSC